MPTLIGLLADWDDKVRPAAATALANIGPAVVPLLLLVFQERELSRLRDRPAFREEVDRLWQQRDAAGDSPVPDRTWRYLTWPVRGDLHERTEAVHTAAATALGLIGPAAAAAVPALTAALHDPRDSVREAVTQALARVAARGG